MDVDTDPPELSSIDFKNALGRLGGDKELLFSLIRVFFRQYRDPAAEIEKLLPTDKDAAYRKAHTLKGVTGNIGAHELYKTFIKLEKAIVTEAVELIPDILSKIKTLYAAMKAEVIPIIAQNIHHEAGTEKDYEGDGTLGELFRELEELLQRHDGKSEDVFQQIKQVLGPYSFRPQMRRLEEGLEMYEYREAIEALCSLKTAVLGKR